MLELASFVTVILAMPAYTAIKVKLYCSSLFDHVDLTCIISIFSAVSKQKVELLLSLHRRCHRRCVNTVVQPITQKVLKVFTSNLEYSLIMTRCSCRTRGITLKAIFQELCPFLTKHFKQNDYPCVIIRVLVPHVVLLLEITVM